MKKLFKNKKLILNSVFTVLVLSILVLNITVFPEFLKITPDVSALEKVTDTEIDVDNTSNVTENIISEEEAIDIAKNSIKNETHTEIPEPFDIDKAQAVAKYVNTNSNSPLQEPTWYIAFLISHEDDISEFFDIPYLKRLILNESETSVLWGITDKESFSPEDKITEVMFVEVNAVTEDYYGFTYFITSDKQGEKTVEEWVDELYDLCINEY